MAPRQFPLTNTTSGPQGDLVTTITQAPNYDFAALPVQLADWILDNRYYSIDWAQVIVVNTSSLSFNGRPPPQTPWSGNGTCMTWWDLREDLFKSPHTNTEDGQLVLKTIFVNATEPDFCTSTALASVKQEMLRRNALSEWLEARAISLQGRTVVSGGGGAYTKMTVSYLSQPQVALDIGSEGKVTAQGEANPTLNFENPTVPGPSPAGSPGNPAPAPSPQSQNQQTPDQINNAVNAGIAQAINNLFPDSPPKAPSQDNPSPQGPAPPNPIPQNGNSDNSQGIGAFVASLFGGVPSNDGNGNPGGNSPQQGQVNGVPYSIAPGGIVISGVTYSTSQPTSVNLPGGQTLVVGANGVVQIGGATVPSPMGPSPPLSGTVNGITYSINPDGTIVVNGQTLNIATPTSITLPGGKVVTVGPNGISFGGTVIPFPSGLAALMPTAMTVAGVAFSVGPGEVVIGGKTYSFPPGSTGTTIVVDGKTISIGPNGIGFPSTTVPLTHPPTTSATAASATTTKASTESSSQTSSTSTTTTTTTTKSSGTSTSPTPAKTTTKKSSAAGFKELLGSVVALELLAIFAVFVI
ncbi:hypothetical protein GP486_007815 [Trichoglossum hirsutum]|uniref:Uncharacterized protein n=1 Tax=Trichoglossum hirsutum TaxID=265104 RepID=A0A9P8IB47_9PEZI|nr:hypothetical protein GP486_007815 [Trichoglossum hirsutum]